MPGVGSQSKARPINLDIGACDKLLKVKELLMVKYQLKSEVWRMFYKSLSLLDILHIDQKYWNVSKFRKFHLLFEKTITETLQEQMFSQNEFYYPYCTDVQ